MVVGAVAVLTFNVVVLCGATPARMNVALSFAEPATAGVFVYDASSHATLLSSGFPILKERVDARTEKVFPVGGPTPVIQDLTLDLRTNDLVGVSLAPGAELLVVDSLPQVPLRSLK